MASEAAGQTCQSSLPPERSASDVAEADESVRDFSSSKFDMDTVEHEVFEVRAAEGAFELVTRWGAPGVAVNVTALPQLEPD